MTAIPGAVTPEVRLSHFRGYECSSQEVRFHSPRLVPVYTPVDMAGDITKLVNHDREPIGARTSILPRLHC